MLIVLIAVVALVLGGLAGWMLRGDDSGSDDVVVVNGAELTERQEEMLRVGDEYFAAERDGDGNKMISLFVEQGHVTAPTGSLVKTEFRVDDGSLEAMVSRATNVGLETYEPVLVFDHTIIYASSRHGGEVDVMKFTPGDDVLIISVDVTR
ncbi:MAG: hypothetical protein QNJ12_13725 [Ilumatobacter sp.]|uniref:hypothetical protein n=1 Tax=Ilumatobacter sp. TaxID=1967498 RepID=UPI0026096462|nr:hypothetical protein [Ilumatobacter sp.]MDJ0769854.1 hypothetical protein [Ilumatobacter sp.]